MSRVLVTGGAGYIGSHAVQALAAAGYDVTVYDDLSAGHPEAVERLAAAFPERTITLERADVLDTATLGRVMAAARPVGVMHFAALLSVGRSMEDPASYYRVNVRGTLSVLDAMLGAGVRCLVFSSTAATFGEPQAIPIDESHPQRPVNPYGETKLAVERALPHYERAAGLRWAALRYFNASGADPGGLIGEDHEPEEHLIPNALRAAAGGAPLTLYGDDYPTPDGTCIRDFVHVSDLAEAHLAALRSLEAGGTPTAYNLGSGHGASVRQVVDAVTRVTGRPVPHRVGARRAGDPARLVASSDRIRRELGWRPRFDALDRIVETAWAWMTQNPQGYRTRRGD